MLGSGCNCHIVMGPETSSVSFGGHYSIVIVVGTVAHLAGIAAGVAFA
jgi:hypothetical protein